jgi:hypothetical protein
MYAEQWLEFLIFGDTVRKSPATKTIECPEPIWKTSNLDDDFPRYILLLSILFQQARIKPQDVIPLQVWLFLMLLISHL